MTDKRDASLAASDPTGLAEAAARIALLFETRIAPALERIAMALERGAVASSPEDHRGKAVADIRRAIRDGTIGQARFLLADLDAEFPDSPEAPALAEELAGATLATIDDRRTRLDAARSANDADAVIGYRDELAALLEPAARDILDADVLKWLMTLLMKRMRTGTVRADVALLAAKVAGSFGHRPEGASIRASLPTLRRSAGLCARCAGEYTGVEDACPKCLALVPKIADLPESPAPST
jgi:hypothetical protein